MGCFASKKREKTTQNEIKISRFAKMGYNLLIFGAKTSTFADKVGMILFLS